jgi:hypothetical protein
MNDPGHLAVNVNNNTRNVALIFDGCRTSDNEDEERSILPCGALLLMLLLPVVQQQCE